MYGVGVGGDRTFHLPYEVKKLGWRTWKDMTSETMLNEELGSGCS